MKHCFSFLLVFLYSEIPLSARPLSGDELVAVDRVMEAYPDTSSTIARLIRSPEVDRPDDSLEINVTEPIKLSKRKYHHFTEAYAMGLAKRFSRRWRTLLKLTEQKYQVNREVIVAIMLIETSFGRFTGNHQVIGTYSGLVADIASWQSSEQFSNASSKLKKRMQKKLDWAAGELNAIAKIAEKYPKWNIYDIRGSYAGAFGKAQFLPSSYLRFAKAYKEMRPRPDLHSIPDAIVSIANYLKSNGYAMPLASEGARQSIFHYNNSSVYVHTVRSVAKKLKKS